MKYIVTGQVTISMYTEVEADSKEEAKKLADERGACSLIDPRQMGDDPEDVWFHSGEIDGMIDVLDAEDDLN